MPHNAVNSISAMHRRFTSPDEWRSMIEPHFAGSRYTRRAHSFSVWGRLERLGDALLVDNYVAASGLGPANDTYGFSIDPTETGSCFILLQRFGSAFVKQSDRATELRAGEWAIFDASVPTSFLIPDGSRTIGVTVSHRYCEHWPRSRTGIPGGESRRALMIRGLAALESIREGAFHRVAVISHGGILAGALKALLRIPAELNPFSLYNASISRLAWNDRIKLITLNELDHLRSAGLG